MGPAVKETCNRTVETNPPYISSLASPMRQKHRDDLFVTRSAADSYYNAWEGDIAIVNIFFGKETVMEYERSIKMGPVDFIASLGGLFGLFLGFSIVSFVEIFYWLVVRGSRIMMHRKM